jgi:hypothetical protein
MSVVGIDFGSLHSKVRALVRERQAAAAHPGAVVCRSA